MKFLSFKISLKDTSFRISINSLGLYLSLQNARWIFFSNFYIPPCVGKFFKFMEFTFLQNPLTWGIFTHGLPHSKFAPNVLSSRPRQKEITHSSTQYSFENLFHPRAGWRKLWFTLSKFSQKIWRWYGTLGFSYFLWFAIYSIVTALQFCK